MVERITDPHQPVRIRGTNRLPDGQGVPVPPAADHVDHSLRNTVLACVLVVAVAVLIGVLR